MIGTLVKAALWVRNHIYLARELFRPVETDPQARKDHLEELRRERAERK